jgi:hypothetical protein
MPDDDGRLLFEQYTSSVPQKLKEAVRRKTKIMYKGKEDQITGYGQERFPGEIGFKVVAHLRHAGEVNYYDIEPLL